MSKAEGNGVVTEKEKESVGNVKLDIEVSRGLNLFYISNYAQHFQDFSSNEDIQTIRVSGKVPRSISFLVLLALKILLTKK